MGDFSYLDFCYNTTSFEISASGGKPFEHSFQICKNESSAKNTPLGAAVIYGTAVILLCRDKVPVIVHNQKFYCFP